MGRRIPGGIRLKGLNRAGTWPSGNPRYYYRPHGRKGVPLPDLPPGHREWLLAYAAASGEAALPRSHSTGSLGAAVIAYLRADVFLALAPLTREARRRAADAVRGRYGDLPLAGLRTRHIRLDLAPLDPHPANNRLKFWRAFCRWCVDAGLRDDDPARDVRPRAAPAGGFTPWDRADLLLFRAHWSHETPQRMAMELIYRTCAAIGDACRLGPANVDAEGWLTYRRAKSGTVATAPFHVPGPDWFEATSDMALCLAHAPRALTWLAVPGGRVRSAKAATQWFSGACREAGLAPGKSAHGLRKLRAAMFREMGATVDQGMAILGHETEAEGRRYSRSADLRRTIEGTGLSNSVQLAPESGAKSIA